MGDFILWLCRTIRQQMLCVHNYAFRATPARAFTYHECVKCERTRDWERNY